MLRLARAAARPGRLLSGEAGMAAITSTVAIAMSMVIFVLCANVIAVMYARGVVRGALDEGARAGAASGAEIVECEHRVGEVLDQLLAGQMGDGVTYACHTDGDQVVATGQAVFPGWLPGMPTASFELAARSVKEPEVVP